MILTEAERNAIEDECEMMIGKPAFDAVEAALIKKLAAVSVEPCAWAMQRPDGMVLDVIDNSEHNRHAGEYNLSLYTAEAVAAARVQGTEEAAKICECQWSTLEERDAGIEFAEAIRALIGGKDEPRTNH